MKLIVKKKDFSKDKTGINKKSFEKVFSYIKSIGANIYEDVNDYIIKLELDHVTLTTIINKKTYYTRIPSSFKFTTLTLENGYIYNNERLKVIQYEDDTVDFVDIYKYKETPSLLKVGYYLNKLSNKRIKGIYLTRYHCFNANREIIRKISVDEYIFNSYRSLFFKDFLWFKRGDLVNIKTSDMEYKPHIRSPKDIISMGEFDYFTNYDSNVLLDLGAEPETEKCQKRKFGCTLGCIDECKNDSKNNFALSVFKTYNKLRKKVLNK